MTRACARRAGAPRPSPTPTIEASRSPARRAPASSCESRTQYPPGSCSGTESVATPGVTNKGRRSEGLQDVREAPRSQAPGHQRGETRHRARLQRLGGAEVVVEV